MVVDNEVRVLEIGKHSLSEPRRLGRQEGSDIRIAFDKLGRYLATANQDGKIHLWDPTGTSPPTIVQGPAGIWFWFHETTGDEILLLATMVEDEHEKVWMWSVTNGEQRLLRRFDLGEKAPATWWRIDSVGGHIARVGWDREIRLWRFSAPADAEPLVLGRDEPSQLWRPSFDQTGRWLATSSASGLALYPLGRSYPSVMRHDVKNVNKVAFGPDGRWLASCGSHEAVRIWPLDGEVPPAGHSPYKDRPSRIAVSPDGEHILVGTTNKGKEQGDLLLSLDGNPRKVLTGFRHYTSGVAFSPGGRLAAGAGGAFDEDENVIRVWDVTTGAELTVLVPEADLHEWTLQFSSETLILATDEDGLRQWDVETGESELLFQGMYTELSLSADGRRVLLVKVVDESRAEEAGRAVVLELETGVATPLETHGAHVTAVALDRTGTIVATGDVDGVIRVGPLTGEQPHLLLGHESTVASLAFDPLGRYVASGAQDGTARLWPMPDLSKPPLHTLPREELIAKLKTLTNLRVVRDEESPTGWTLTHDPFPGWETVPTW